jgi:hypothetical protein
MERKNIQVISSYDENSWSEFINNSKYNLFTENNFSLYDIADKYDGVLFYDCTPFEINTLSSLNIPVTGCARYEKKIQKLILDKLNIPSPKTFARRNNFKSDNDIKISIYLLSSGTKKVLLKDNNGARGLGQILVDAQSISSILHDHHTLEVTTFIDKYKSIIGGNIIDTDFNHIHSTLNNRDFIITEYLIDIIHEYRLIISNTEELPFIFERARKVDKEIIQANLSGDGGTTHSLMSDFFVTEFIKHPIYLKLKELLKFLNTPFLSIDLYEREDHSYGVFEFQMEFGFDSFLKHNKVSELISFLSNSIEYSLFGQVI